MATTAPNPAQGREQVFTHVGDGVCQFDAGLVLRSANPRVAEVLGLPTALLVAGTPLQAWLRHLADAGHYGSDDIEQAIAWRLERLTQPEQQIVRRARPDGRMIETRCTPLPDGGFVMVCVDVTERLASEAALFENRRTLEVLLARTEEGFWFIDNAHRTTDANPAMCRILGLTRDELLGRKIGAIGLFSEVTAERAAEAAARDAFALAREKSRVLALTLDSLSQGVLGFDAQQRLNSWNQRAMELLELPQDLLASRPTVAEIGRWQQGRGDIGEAPEEIKGERLGTTLHCNIGVDAESHPDPSRHRYRRKDGRMIEVCIHRGSDGGQVRAYTDVTEAELAARALMDARDEAERANRAKSVFLSRMSHELRTPLNAILGFGQLMQADAAHPLGAPQRQRLQQVLHGGQHLLSLINEVLDLAQIETGALALSVTAVDADAVADACLDLMARVAAQREVQLRQREGSAGMVQADAMRLRQVLLNLLANAIKYNRRGGEVRLQAAARSMHMRIEVLDTGPGLDEAQRQRLFQPFERLGAQRDAIEGTGIGLALSRSLVEAMGGRIGVHSTPGQGSCFWVELPCGARAAHGTPVERPASIAPADATGARRHRVLYVEDNAVNQIVMEGMLSQRPGIDLLMASCADEALALARQSPPDLVLMDIQLPGASGYEVLQALRTQAALRAVPVLAVSANALPTDLQRARDAGFDDYLTKPLDLRVLLAALERWLEAPRA